MKNKRIVLDQFNAPDLASASHVEPARVRARDVRPAPCSDIETSCAIHCDELAASEFSQQRVSDNPKWRVCWEQVRRQFQTRHGRSADLPRRRVGTKEFRKALIAAEMAWWNSYELGASRM